MRGTRTHGRDNGEGEAAVEHGSISQPRADDIERLTDGHRDVVVVDDAVRREEHGGHHAEQEETVQQRDVRLARAAEERLRQRVVRRKVHDHDGVSEAEVRGREEDEPPATA